MDIGTVPEDLKMVALLRCAIPKAREPYQWHHDGPTVYKINH